MKSIACKRNICLLLALAIAKAAQPIPEIGPDIGLKMKQNAEALKHYSYKRRTEVEFKGKSRGARVDLVRYIDGKRETVPLETPARPAESAHGHGLRGKMMEKKIEGKKEEVEHLKSLLQNYAPGSDSMNAALEKAAISRTGPEQNADIKIVAAGPMKPSDSFTLLWSVANHRPAHIEIRADVDGKPIRITTDYAALQNGPFYAAHTVLSDPKKELNVNIDTFDYTSSSGTK